MSSKVSNSVRNAKPQISVLKCCARLSSQVRRQQSAGPWRLPRGSIKEPKRVLPLINFVVRMTKCTLRASASATDTSPAKTARQKVRAHSPDNPRCATAHARTAPTVHTAQQQEGRFTARVCSSASQPPAQQQSSWARARSPAAGPASPSPAGGAAGKEW